MDFPGIFYVDSPVSIRVLARRVCFGYRVHADRRHFIGGSNQEEKGSQASKCILIHTKTHLYGTKKVRRAAHFFCW